MDREPTKPYVYQPEPAHKGDRIFGVAGPGTDWLAGLRFTREEADAIVDSLTRGVTTSGMLKALGSTPQAKSAIRKRRARYA